MADSPVNQPQKDRAMFAQAMRIFLRDQPNLNTLLSGYETSDQQLVLCVTLALADWNGTPPLIGNVGIRDHPSADLLVKGTLIQVLTSAGLLQSRNDLDYQAGGITVRVSNKAGQYQAWLQFLVQSYEMGKKNLKMSLNLESCYGGIPSEYRIIEAGGMFSILNLDGFSVDGIMGGGI